MSHTWVLVIAYASVCVLWWCVRWFTPLWPDADRPRLARPWVEVTIALLAGVAVLALGQLWMRGIRLTASGPWGSIAEAVNQVIIFSPIVAVPIIRRQGWASAWVRPDRLPARLAIGLGLALVALLIYSGLERGAPSWPETIRGVFAPSRAHHAVQVLLEDLVIAILFFRLSAAVRPVGAILGVAALFAAGHVPSLLAQGATPTELVGLARDFGLVVLVLGTLSRSADIAWFWPVHYSLDMTQFLSGRG